MKLKFGDLKSKGNNNGNDANQTIMVQQDMRVSHMRQTVGPNFYKKRDDVERKDINRSMSHRKNKNILFNTPKSLSQRKSKKSLNLRELENFMIGEMDSEPRAKIPRETKGLKGRKTVDHIIHCKKFKFFQRKLIFEIKIIFS